MRPADRACPPPSIKEARNLDATRSALLPVALVIFALILPAFSATTNARAPQTKSNPQSKAGMKSKTSDLPLKKFVRGPSLQPKAEFVAWVESHIRSGSKRYLRVPLVLKRGQVGFSLGGARIGPAADAIEVYANDSALGIGLADRALTHCKGRKTCAFWVEGRLAKEPNGTYRLDVMRFVSPIQPGALASANYVEVEELTIPEPGESEQGFPLPRGARRNAALDGATSLAPGKNYMIRVYEVDVDLRAIDTFYGVHLPKAKRSTPDHAILFGEGEEYAIVFSTPRGSVVLSPSSVPRGTRIKLAIGPQ